MEILFVILMGIIARLAGNGFGKKWNMSWLPELIYVIPFGLAFGWVLNNSGVDFIYALGMSLVGTLVSYGGMQSGTWMFLQWEGHKDPDTHRTSTLKVVIDFIAKLFGYKLGDEGYSWVAAGVKGFIIGLPVGGAVTAVLWALGYEVGSHAKGRVEKYGIDPHAFSEFFAGAFGAVSILIFIKLFDIVVL